MIRIDRSIDFAIYPATPLRSELKCPKMWGLKQQQISAKMKIWHPWQFKKSFGSYQLNSTANSAHVATGFWFFQLPWVPNLHFSWNLMASNWEKSTSILARNLNSGRSYHITTVQNYNMVGKAAAWFHQMVKCKMIKKCTYVPTYFIFYQKASSPYIIPDIRMVST